MQRFVHWATTWATATELRVKNARFAGASSLGGGSVRPASHFVGPPVVALPRVARGDLDFGARLSGARHRVDATTGFRGAARCSHVTGPLPGDVSVSHKGPGIGS